MNRKERRLQAKAAKKSAQNPDRILAEQLAHQGRTDDAIAAFKRALKADKKYADGHYNLGVLFEDKGNLEEAASSYRKAIRFQPDNVDAHFNLGNVVNRQGNMEQAVACYEKAVSLEPGFIAAHNNLGNVLKDLGRMDQAIDHFQKVIALRPDYAQAHNNLGNAFKEQNNLQEAAASYRKAVSVNPDYGEAYFNLGNTLQLQGDIDGAIEQLDLAISHEPDSDAWRFRKALLLPIIPYSCEDIENRRGTLGRAVKDLHKQDLNIADPLLVGTTNFHLSYHHLDDKKLMEDIAKLYLAACPKLSYQASHCRSATKPQRERLRIGFLSSFFYDHTIGKLCRGIIEQFSRDTFEVIVFKIPGKQDHLSKAIEDAADKVVALNKMLDTDWDIIAGQELDILFYPDIGMDPYSYFLSFARLAPVQAVTWGHPDTTGIPNIDYFISSDLLEPTNSASQFTEQLAQISLLPTYYYRPELTEQSNSRADFDLPDTGSLYVCPQALFKFHPLFDEILGDLLTRDTQGHLVLIDDGKGGHWNKLILDRIGRAYPGVVDQVIFIPRMSADKFMGLLNLADALLDVPTFSGGNSSMEAFAMGAPIVTWPGDFMRSRVTAGCYRQMGLDKLIASNGEEYVSLALKLANDDEFKNRMREEIRANDHKLFERIDAVRELENIFVEASQSA